MEGIAGQFVSLPLVREASFIAGARFFGYQGIEIWYAPIPIHNYGEATVQFRQIELTGTSIRGIIKAEIVVFPELLPPATPIMPASMMYCLNSADLLAPSARRRLMRTLSRCQPVAIASSPPWPSELKPTKSNERPLGW